MEVLKKIGKVVLYIIAGLIILLFVAGLFIDPIVKNLLEKQVSNAAEGQYSLRIEDLDISVLGGDVELSGLRFDTDTTDAETAPIAFLKANKMAVEGVSWLKYLLTQKLQTDRIVLDNFDVAIYARTVEEEGQTDTTQSPLRFEQLDIYPAIKDQVDRVLLKDLALNQISFLLVNIGTKDTLQFDADRLNLQSDNILLDANKLITENRAFYATEIDFDAGGIDIKRSGQNNIEAIAASFSLATNENIMGIQVKDFSFLQKNYTETDTLTFAAFQKFQLQEFNLNRLQEDSVASLEKVSLSGASFISKAAAGETDSSAAPDTTSAAGQVSPAKFSGAQMLPDLMKRLKLNVMDINQVDIRLGDTIVIQDANLHATQMVLDEQPAFAENRFLHAKTFESNIELIAASVGENPALNVEMNTFKMEIEDGTGSLGFQELSVKPEEQPEGEMWYKAAVGPFKITGIDTRKIPEEELSIDSIGIMDPVVLVNMAESKSATKPKPSEPQTQTSPPNLYPLIAGVLEKLSLRKLAIIEGDFRIADIAGSDYGIHVPAFYMQMRDVLIAEGTAFAGERVLHAADIAVRMENVSYPMPDSIYSVKLGLFRLSTYEQFLEADNLSLTFSDNYEQTLKRTKTNQVFSISNDDFRMDGIQFGQIFQNKGVYVQSVKSSGLDVYVYTNDKIPTEKASENKETEKRSDSPGMPQKMLNEIGMPLFLGEIELRSGHFIYEQLASEADTAGVFEITDLYFLADNVTNIPRKLKADPEIALKAGGKLMGSGAFKTEMVINMLNDSSLVRISGKVDTLDMTKLNRLAIYTTPVAISSGTLYEMDWNIKADERNATGTLLMSYEDLKIQVSSPSSSDTTGVFKDIGSFLVNKLALEEDVPADDPEKPEKAEISVERDKDKGFVNYYISALMDGLKEIVVTIF